MSEEEKEAIEQIKSWRDFIVKNKDKVNKANDIEFYLRTILNLIDRLQKENEELKWQHRNKCKFDNEIFIGTTKRDYISKNKIKEQIQVFKKEGSQTSLIIASVLEELLEGE